MQHSNHKYALAKKPKHENYKLVFSNVESCTCHQIIYIPHKYLKYNKFKLYFVIQLLHRRLGARNVLLKNNARNQLIAKVAGFGPMKGEQDGNDSKTKVIQSAVIAHRTFLPSKKNVDHLNKLLQCTASNKLLKIFQPHETDPMKTNKQTPENHLS